MDTVDYKKLWLDYMVRQVREKGLADIKFGFGPDKDPDVTDEEWEQDVCKHLYLAFTGKYPSDTEMTCVIGNDTNVTWEVGNTSTTRLRGQAIFAVSIDDRMEF